jgi:HTH-type transcriptional regulator/antitoxin HipB
MDFGLHFSEQLKQHLRALRKARGLTQVRLAQKLGVGQSRVADIEANPGAMSVDQLFKVLAALDVQLVLRDKQAASSVEPLSQREPAASDEGAKPTPPKGSW